MAFDQVMYTTTTLISGQTRDGVSAHHLSQLKASIDREKEKLRRMVAAFADKSGPVREAAMVQIDALGAEIKDRESELVDGHRQGGLIETDGFLARFMASRAKMETGDLDERLLGRAVLASEFRRIIESVVLHANRSITLHMKPDASGCRTVYAISSDGFLGIHRSGPEERKTSAGQSVFHRVVKHRTRPEPAQVIYTADGNWQTALIE